MTTTISIPTHARGKVRAFIKADPRFPQWLAQQGVPSRDVKNSSLLDFAESAGLIQQVRQIISEADLIDRNEPTLDREFHQAMRIEGDKERETIADAKADKAAATVKAAPSVFSANDILRGIDQFLSPLVRKELEGALGPVVKAANKPAVVTEKVVTQVVDAEGKLVAPARPAPVQTDAISIGKLFGLKGSQGFLKTMIHQWDSHGAAPAIDPRYVVDAVNMSLLATAAETETNVWLVGPAGSGKTSLPEQFAAFTGRPFTKIACSRHTEVSDLIGGDGIRAGATLWNDGALVAAMKVPGMVILIDEPTLAPPGVQAIFQNVTDDHRSYTVHATGEVVKCAKGVVFVVADNTNGLGDDTGQYAGTHQANAALVNRFKRMVRVEYMSKSQETTALMNHTGIPQNAAAHVVDFFATARRLPDMEGMVLSLRQMVGLVGAVKDGFPVKVAMETAVLNKLASTERAAIEVLASLDWSDTFEALLTGSPKAVETNTPSNSQAASAFDDEISASLTR